jgi:hypothetical protein
MCRNGPFSILCDEGSDCDDKNFAILVRFWDKNQEKPVTRFFDMPISNIADAATLFNHIDTALSTRGVPWANVVGFESDTTNVMVGKHNSVLSRVKSEQPKVFSLGCTCHLANLCLLSGVRNLPIDIDDFFVDLYYFFDKSAKRKHEFREFQEFTSTKELKIIKHCKTRWLSLEKVVKRVLVQWNALHAYFDKEAESNNAARVLRLNAHFKSHMTKLVLLFLEFALESMTKFNAAFQSSLPKLPALREEVLRLFRILLKRFLKTEFIKSAVDNFSSIEFTPEKLIDDEYLGIGHKTWAYITEEEDYFARNVKENFFSGVRNFYVATATTMVKNFSTT